MDAANFLHHEKAPTWDGVEPANMNILCQRLTNYASCGYWLLWLRQSGTKHPVLGYKQALYSFIDPMTGLKAESTLPSPGFESRICGEETHCTTTQTLGFLQGNI
ncbi:hypothetical protein TNCV_3108941 [Trichonephila clavipes]|nr:hypothetical protein TNCV_3108941 [Trichonephila clavipes]